MDGWGPLDHARADRMAEEKLKYRVGEEQGVRSYLYLIGDFVIWDCDIASGDFIADGKGWSLKCDVIMRYQHMSLDAQGLIGWQTDNRDIASAKDKGLGAFSYMRYVIMHRWDCDIALGNRIGEKTGGRSTLWFLICDIASRNFEWPWYYGLRAQGLVINQPNID